jgi:uncharacterized protein
MTPDERRLITGLFDRMRDYGTPEKDRDAESLIMQSVRATPDAPYMLVQSVLVQEQALEAANARVQELEERVRSLEDGASARPQGSGSFLGGLFGGARSAAPEGRSSSVPQVGARATPPAYGGGQPWAQQSPMSQPPPSQPGPAPASGGFMRSALATAAGVAGGMLVADSLRNMMGSAHAHTAGADKANAGTEETEYFDENDNDPGTFGSDSGGGFDGGVDV